MRYHYKNFFDYIELENGPDLGDGQGRNRVIPARDKSTGRRLAIKEILIPRHASKKLKEVTEREVQNMNILGAECKYIVPLLDYKECEWETATGSGSSLLLAMPRYEKTLDTEMMEHYKRYAQTGDPADWYDPMTICTIGIDICEALSYAHTKQLPMGDGTVQKGVVHRDIKPENIFWDDILKTYVLGDFGSSKLFDGKTTKTRASGTSGYCAPEQNFDDNECGPWTDIYSLGIILYVLGNGGFFPFAREDEPLVAEDFYDEEGGYLKRYSEREEERCPFPMPRLLDDELAAIILKACEFRKEDRYQTAGEMLADLKRMQMKLLSGQVKVNVDRTAGSVGDDAVIDKTPVTGVLSLNAGEKNVAAGSLFGNTGEDNRITADQMEFLKKSLSGQDSKVKKASEIDKTSGSEKSDTGRKVAIAVGVIVALMVLLMFVKNFAPYFVGSHTSSADDETYVSTTDAEEKYQLDQVLYDDKGIKITADYVNYVQDGGWYCHFIIENNSDQDMRVSTTGDIKINDITVEHPDYGLFVYGFLEKGASGEFVGDLDKSFLEEQGIDSDDEDAVQSLVFNLHFTTDLFKSLFDVSKLEIDIK